MFSPAHQDPPIPLIPSDTRRHSPVQRRSDPAPALIPVRTPAVPFPVRSDASRLAVSPSDSIPVPDPQPGGELSGNRSGARPADRPIGRTPRRSSADLRIERLQGWHLPLLDDAAFLPLQALLQRTLLLAVPRRLVSSLVRRGSLASLVLLAHCRDRHGLPRILGLIVATPTNRRGSCWEVEHLRLALSVHEHPSGPGAAAIASGLLREAIQQTPGAASWIATTSSLDIARLATLREQGFQPQRTDSLWRWQARGATPPADLPPDLQLVPLQRRSAPLLWHLEQAVCSAPLRQVLDRRIEDLLDRSDGHGWLLVDRERNVAVAAARRIGDHPGGGHQVEMSVHPGWTHLHGPCTELLLRRLAPAGDQLWLHCESGDQSRRDWLRQIGAEEHGDVVLMARSLWRRQELHPPLAAASRLGAVLERLQPRGRTVPTPLVQR